MDDYKRAKDLGLTQIDRWSHGEEHHPLSKRLLRFLMDHDYQDYNDQFGWKCGGDGDNGETLAYQIDAFFEMMDQSEKVEEVAKPTVWILTEEYNYYDQMGEYFVSWFKNKPSKEAVKKILEGSGYSCEDSDIKDILDGGGRRKRGSFWADHWYNLKEVEEYN